MLMGESSGTSNTDLDDLAISIKGELSYHRSLFEVQKNEGSIIRRVQNSIRLVAKNAYEPVLISIGPYYRGTPSLSVTEKEKWACLDYILKLNRERNLLDYLEVMSRLAEQARKSYSEEVQMEEDKLLEMLLLDGSFVLVTLHGVDGILGTMREEYSCSSSKGGELEGVKIENQEVKNSVVHMIFKAIRKGSNEKETIPQVELTDFICREGIQSDKPVVDEEGRNKEYSQQKGAWCHTMVAHDLLLLENQVPFFVVNGIYGLLSPKGTTSKLLTVNICKCVEGILFNYPKGIQESERPEDFHNLLHLCHIYCPSRSLEKHQNVSGTQYFGYFRRKYFNDGNRPQDNQYGRRDEGNLFCSHTGKQLLRWRRAEQYHDAGIEFRKRAFVENNPHSLLDVKFTHGLVELPFLMIDDKTSYLFRNLMAFEQTSPQFGNNFTAYVSFISRLISTPEDVMLSVESLCTRCVLTMKYLLFLQNLVKMWTLT